MNLITFLVNVLSDRALPTDSPRRRFVTEHAPQIAAGLLADDHAMADLMRDVCIDIRANPTEAHERLLRSVRNSDDAALACEFRLLIAQYLLDAAKDRAADEYRAQDLERAA